MQILLMGWMRVKPKANRRFLSMELFLYIWGNWNIILHLCNAQVWHSYILYETHNFIWNCQMKGSCHRTRFDLVCPQTLHCWEVLTQFVHTLFVSHKYSIQTLWLTISKSQRLHWKLKNRKYVMDLKKKKKLFAIRRLAIWELTHWIKSKIRRKRLDIQ